MTTTTDQTFTDADRDEWNALMDQVRTLTEQTKEAEQEAGSWIRWSIKNDDAMELAIEKAKEFAARAEVLWAERNETHDRARALPFGQHVEARVDALRKASGR